MSESVSVGRGVMVGMWPMLDQVSVQGERGWGGRGGDNACHGVRESRGRWGVGVGGLKKNTFWVTAFVRERVGGVGGEGEGG